MVIHLEESGAAGSAVADNRAVAARTRFTIVAGQQVRNERVNLASLVAAKLAIFIHRNILVSTHLLGRQNGLHSLSLQLIQQVTSIALRHGGQFYSALYQT